MKQNKHIDEGNLDNLLNAYALNEFSAEHDLAMAQIVFDQDYDVELSPKQEAEMLERLNPNRNWMSAINLMWLWIIIALLTVVATVYVYYSRTPSVEKVRTSVVQTTSASGWNHEISELEPVLAANDSSLQETYYKAAANMVETMGVDSVLTTPEAKKVTQKQVSTTDAPLFSEEDIRYYQQLKVDMITKLLAYEEEIYTPVEEARITYKNQKIGVAAYIIRNFPVTNMEYKAFLSDLMRVGNQQALQVAMVKDSVWLDYGCEQLGAAYFRSKDYDAFPVVNISPEAALLFCQWMEIQTNNRLKLNNKKAKPIKIRLPYDTEWISGCKSGMAQTAMCNGYQTIYDKSEGLVSDVFLKRLKKIQLKDAKNKTSVDDLFELNRYGRSEGEILDVFKRVLPDNTLVYPNGFGKIAKAAHVSEFIQNPEEKIIVFGACWTSKQQYAQMLSEFKKQAASPFIGFRFIVEDKSAVTYKNPFW